MQPGFVSGLLSRISRVPDRLLHSGRRRAALALLAGAERAPASVLVICNGNIFRSPFAAAVLRRALELRGLGRIRVDSAGFAGPGRPTPADAVAAAAQRGVDLGHHASQLVMADVVRAADLIVVMDAMQRRMICERFGRSPRGVLLLGDFDPLPVVSRGIEDPVEQGREVCARVYARIERCVEELAQALGALAQSRRSAVP
jgi:protein-tyrosine-phosphatase